MEFKKFMRVDRVPFKSEMVFQDDTRAKREKSI